MKYLELIQKTHSLIIIPMCCSEIARLIKNYIKSYIAQYKIIRCLLLEKLTI